MFLKKRNSCRFTLRSAVVPVLLFYGLASARALVPGLCATQSALDDQHDPKSKTCCVMPKQSTSEDGEPTAVEQHEETVRCGFCALSKALVQPLVHCLYEQRMRALMLNHAVEIEPLHLPDVWRPAAPRDPPAGS